MQHKSVLLDEVLEGLAIQPNGIYVDATFGRGGHSRAILEWLDRGGRLFAMDRDLEAITAAQEDMFSKDERFAIHHGNFSSLQHYLAQHHCLGKVNGLLLDLGVSSPQLDDAARGFSFMRDGPLDMRMNSQQGESAAQWLSQVGEEELAKVLKEYGEERYAKRIANRIVAARNEAPITTTARLAEIVKEAHPHWEPGKHPATRVFQAIRIFVNRELEELQQVLEQSLEVLAPGGRLAVISFHSLEDNYVKEFIKQHATTANLPRHLPLTNAQLKETLKIKRVGGAIRASQQEINDNPRARSAILRVMEKLL
jgi:16S rRNA (cytosine1402-N4)-methyltransferase